MESEKAGYPTPALRINSELCQAFSQLLQLEIQPTVPTSAPHQHIQQAIQVQQQPGLDVGPPSVMINPGVIRQPADPPVVPRITTNAGVPKRVLQERMHLVRSPNTPDKQQRIMQVLKRHPALMTEYIKKRKSYMSNQGQPQAQQTPLTCAPRRSTRQSNPVQQQPRLDRGPRVMTINPGVIHEPIDTAVVSRVATNLDVPKTAVQELLKLLKYTDIPHRLEKILQILKGYPPLMGLIMKYRKSCENKQRLRNNIRTRK